jgi:hypothetical protein
VEGLAEEREEGGGGGMPAEGVSIGVHRHPARTSGGGLAGKGRRDMDGTDRKEEERETTD